MVKSRRNKKSYKSSNRRTNNRRTNNRNKYTIKGRGKSPTSNKPTSNKVKCSICDTMINKNDALIPAKCLMKHGQRGHRICNDCWWSKFAIEGTNHECPGCENDLPLTKVSPKITETIVISD